MSQRTIDASKSLRASNISPGTATATSIPCAIRCSAKVSAQSRSASTISTRSGGGLATLSCMTQSPLFAHGRVAFSLRCLLVLDIGGNADGEARAAPIRAFDRDRATHHSAEALTESEAQTGAAIF